MTTLRLPRAIRWSARTAAFASVVCLVVLWAGAADADEPATGSITIVVDASPNDAQDFMFTGCHGATDCGPFVLDDDDDPIRSNTTGSDLPPGTYTVTQDAVAHWATEIACDAGGTISLANRRATIDLTAGEHVTCTFTNTSASIAIQQSSDPAAAHDFTFTGCLGAGCSTFSLDDDDDATLPDRTGSAGLAPGTYVITQADDAEWALVSIVCTTGETVSLANRRVTITLSPGEQTSCKFANRAPSIGLTQHTAPEAPEPFTYTGCLGSGCADFTMDRDPETDARASFRTAGLSTGTYTITQAPNANWPLSAISCPGESVDLANRRVTITLTKGEQASCTFTNTSASLAIVADTTPDGPQDFEFEGCVDAGCSRFTLDDDNDAERSRTTGKVPLPPGTYTVTADAVAGYELSDLSCTTEEAVDLDARRVTITLGVGEQQTCTFAHRPPPPPLTDVSQISVGINHSCALVSGGEARCWGYGQDGGALGDGTFENSTVPVVVENGDGGMPLTGLGSISAGFGHTCATLTSGEARCWGYNIDGVGDGTTSIRSRPVTVTNEAGTAPLTDVAETVAAAGYSCAVLTSGEARCWGANGAGQLGDGTNASRLRPVAVSNEAGTGPLTDVTQIAGGISHSCALLASGEARCWGSNTDGRLGDGTTTNRTRPVVVSNPEGTGPLTGIAQLTVGYFQTCAVLDTAEAVCWGTNANGQIGDGTTTSRPRPVPVSSPDGTGTLAGVSQITAGDEQTCATTDSGGAYCWGSNGAGGIGDGTVSERHRPVPVVTVDGSGLLTNVAGMSTGPDHTCARLTSGEVRCWGRNGWGNLGDGTTATRLRPVATIDPSVALEPLSGVTQMSTGRFHTCARLESGEARCWGSFALGNPDFTEALVAVPVVDTDATGPLTGVTQLSAGKTHTCAVRTDTGAVCWGANGSGQLGDGTTTSRFLPVPVLNENGTAPLTGIVQIDAGANETCAVLTNQQVACWGGLPVVVGDGSPGGGPLTDVAQVSVGEDRACVTLTTGQARCWGHTPGDGTTAPPSTAPVVVSNPENTGPLTDVRSIEAGSGMSCAVLTDGQARCWGSPTGDGTWTTRARPVVVADPSGSAPLQDVVSIRIAGDHTCATLSTGQARCWGTSNQFGELGTPPPAPGSSLPLVVNDPTDGGAMSTVVDIIPGQFTTCALRTSGQARCWGLGSFHSLGNGTARTRYTPTTVLTSVTPP